MTPRPSRAAARLLLTIAVIVPAVAAPGTAQTTGAGYADALTPSLAGVAKAMHATIRRDLAEAADSMPAEEYSFRPTPESRTFGQLVGHVINANLFFCTQAAATGQARVTNYESVTDKAALVKALGEALASCDRIYGATTDATFSQPVEMQAGVGMGPARTVRGAVLMFNVAHNNEHYGSITVYMRLKGHVPPSTARTSAAAK